MVRSKVVVGSSFHCVGGSRRLCVVALVINVVLTGYLLKEKFFDEACEIYNNSWCGAGGLFLRSLVILLVAKVGIGGEVSRKVFVFQSIFFLESVSGQIPRFFILSVGRGVWYLEG